jgi:hypothetical protein
MLRAQLAQVTKERDDLRVEVINLRDTRDALTAQLAEAKEYGRVREHRRHELADEVMELRVVLAQVTKERDELAETSNHNARLHYEQAERACHAEAQLATAKREYRHDCAEWHNEGIGCTHCHRVIYPATPSGQWCIRCGDTCKPWCHNATPSGETREMPSEVVVRVEDAYATEYSSPVVRITPADAKRIMDMAQRNI